MGSFVVVMPASVAWEAIYREVTIRQHYHRPRDPRKCEQMLDQFFSVCEAIWLISNGDNNLCVAMCIAGLGQGIWQAYE